MKLLCEQHNIGELPYFCIEKQIVGLDKLVILGPRLYSSLTKGDDCAFRAYIACFCKFSLNCSVIAHLHYA